MRRRAALVVVAVLAIPRLGLATPKPIDPATWVAATGDYTEDGGVLRIAIAQGQVALTSGDDVSCPATVARGMGTKKTVRISARWVGCSGFKGRVRLRTVFARGSFDALSARLRVRKHARGFSASRARGNPGDCAGRDTFDLVQSRIFGPRSCRIITCHGAGAEGGLDLQAGRAYDSLVGVPAANEAAAAGGKQRVVPGDSAASFLVQKLAGSLATGEGDAMPLGRRSVSALELDLVRAWIDGGAPRTGTVANAPCPPRPKFEAAEPLAPPEGGYQLVLEGPTLAPGEELEGCMWAQVPTDHDFYVGRWEYSLNPGTHHFAVWEHASADPPETDVFHPGDVACIGSGARFAFTISGAPEAPYFVDAYPAGVGKLVKAGAYLGLNPHYYNEFDEPVPIKVWVNLYPVEGALEHVADSLLSITASLNGITPFNIFVPPGQQATLHTRFTNATGAPMSILQLTSHMHKRGVRFRAWHSDGQLFYENSDWAHPAISVYPTPLVLAAGDYIDYECLEDNGVTRPVRHCGDAAHDAFCAPGSEIPVTFGTSAEDEMCLLTGLFY